MVKTKGHFMSYQEYQEVPAFEQAVYKDGMPSNKPPEGVLIWAGKVAPPPVGEKIMLTINSLGEAAVVGYFGQDGYLGLRTKLDNPPAWYLKQNGGNKVGHVFGPEFKPLEAK
jgi:hypothetical protein